jgi:hypothetical protein
MLGMELRASCMCSTIELQPVQAQFNHTYETQCGVCVCVCVISDFLDGSIALCSQSVRIVNTVQQQPHL